MDPASGKVTRPPSLASSVTAPPLPLRPGSAPPPPKPPRAAAAGRSITPSTISRASDLPTSDVVLYENERRNEVGVFSSLNLLPTDPPAWCDASSQPTLSADALELTSGWEWVGKWVPDSWAYSNRVSGPWVDAEGDCVFRRRKWTRRKRKKHAGAAPAARRDEDRPRKGGYL
ncbi:hypothetical protein DFJ74DRAFT_680673 [Hyaloraphidium curvatum]|nr:hypothetical protein DFJ74DRAFT_680673 [Hyaloraphidium curvatum]